MHLFGGMRSVHTLEEEKDPAKCLQRGRLKSGLFRKYSQALDLEDLRLPSNQHFTHATVFSGSSLFNAFLSCVRQLC